MIKTVGKKWLAAMLSVAVILAIIPVTLFIRADTEKSGVLLDVNFNEEDAIAQGSPVADNMVATKDAGTGSIGATVSQIGSGTLTYHFANLREVGKASALVAGRAILGASVTIQVSTDGSAWKDVKKFVREGDVDWNFQDVTLLDLTPWVKGETGFYLRLAFDDGASGDWAMIRTLRVASVAASQMRDNGVVLNSRFTEKDWIAAAASAHHISDTTGSLTIADAGYTRDHALDGERSEERRVGKECASKCRSRWSPYH